MWRLKTCPTFALGVRCPILIVLFFETATHAWKPWGQWFYCTQPTAKHGTDQGFACRGSLAVFILVGWNIVDHLCISGMYTLILYNS